MVILGNPPYSVSSSNASIDSKGEKTWIGNLIADYKKDLNERKINLDDDYIKFIRYGQHYIDKNGSGVLAYISNNSFIDGITHRQMRKHLLESFDKIYILDLHGSAKKNEKALDGSKDENIFDIQQGVSINIFIKTSNKKKIGEVFHSELFGKREEKYSKLHDLNLKSILWNKLDFKEPNYFFIPKKFNLDGNYEAGMSLSLLFRVFSTGIESKCDDITIQFSSKIIKEVVKDFIEKSESELQKIYKRENSAGWNYVNAKSDLIKNNPQIIPIAYRPFDIRYTAYSGQSSGFLGRPRSGMNSNLIQSNFAISSTRSKRNDSSCYFITKNVTDKSIASSLDNNYIFPLYLYPETNAQQTINQTKERTPNLNMEIVKEIGERLGMAFANEKTSPTPPKEGLCLSGNEKTYQTSPKEGLNQPKTREGHEKPGYITANSSNYLLIKEMRDVLKDNPTEAEKVIWEYLRNKKTGHKIRRQHIIDDFITDFVCLRKKTVIEIDGKIHLKQKEYDEIRTLRLNELGYEIIRYTNEEVFNNPELVTSKIKICLDNKEDLQNDEPDSPPLEGLGEVFAPIDILDYIYAVLHSPSYREKYKEFLKIDFPRVPYPTSPQPSPEEREQGRKKFWTLVKLGGELRQIHLLESPVVEKRITTYSVAGNNLVEKIKFDLSPALSEGEGAVQLKMEKAIGKVWINDVQYFDGVPQIAWEFYIGGYQPAQKWLKDRKGRELSFEDIVHYQKIVVALAETDRLMKEIDNIEIE